MSDESTSSLGFLQFMEAAPDAMVCVDESGAIVLVNQQAQTMFGYTRVDMVGNKIEMLIPERYRTAHVGHRDGYIASPHVRPMGAGMELKALRNDGREFPVEISLSPIEVDEGRLVAAAIRDVTDRKEMEQKVREAQQREQQLQQLEQLDEFRTRFINAAAHELFTPLTPIAATLSVLRKKGGDPVKRDKALEILDRSFGRLSGLVSDLLEASRFQSGRLSVQREHADLVSAVSSVVDAFRASAKERSIELSLTTPEEMICTFDEKRINQVLYNLTSNALKFTPDGGKIQVSMEDMGGDCVIRVQDTGLGLTQDQLTRIFEPFVRLHEDSAPGTGLGLYISQGIIEAHGGTLTAESDGVGKGTTFIIRAPLEGVDD